MIQMIVFDMAGTTVDEDNLVYKTVQKAINEKGYQFSLEEVLAEGAGKEKLQAIKSVLALKGIDDETLANTIFQNFLLQLEQAYNEHPTKEQKNATALFAALKAKGIKVVLNTGYDRKTAEKLVNKIGWQIGIHIDGLVTASDVPKNRPHPDMILLAMQQQGITNPLEVAKVGDSAIDIEEGRNAGCHYNIGITTGAHTIEQLKTAHPLFIIDDLMELLVIVEKSGEDGLKK